MKQQKYIIVALILLIFPFFFFFGPGYGTSRSFQSLWDLGHILFFALASYFLISFSTFLREKNFGRQLFWILAIVLAGGLLIELIQGGFTRTPSVPDMLRNLAGALFSLFFFSPSRKDWPTKMLHVFQFLIVLAVLSAIIPLATALTDEMNAEAEFPVLADFETPLEKSRWEGGARMQIGSEVASSGRCSLKIFLDTSTYSGVALVYFPGNWQAFDSLVFDIFNPASDPIKITCRIHDRQHTQGVQYFYDRYNRNFQVKNGWNRVRVDLEEVENAPKTRKINMADIRGLGIFATRLPKTRIIHLDNVRLVAKSGS